MKKTIFVLTCCLLASFLSATAQYKSGVGLRFDRYVGVSYKYNTNSAVSYEGILTGFKKGIKLTGLIEVHQATFNDENLRTYVGGGAHFGSTPPYIANNNNLTSSGTQFGVDGIAGVEYTLHFFPLNFSLDWKPEFNFTHNTGLSLLNFGASIRVALK